MTSNAEILDRFKRLTAAGRLAHAYLLVGPAGVGKKDMAMALAQLVNCEQGSQGPCGVCAICRKISSGNHPDVHTGGKDPLESIKIEEVRQILGRAGLCAYEGRCKVFIFSDIERMTNEASNALLKTLEEPAPGTLILLTTAVPEACLDTVKSRCHKVEFFSARDPLPADKDRILDVLLSQGRNDEAIKELASDKHKAGCAMLVLLSYLRDVILFKSGVDRRELFYQDRFETVQKMSARNMDDLSALNAQIVRVKALADENLNVKMALSLVRERLWGN